MNDSSYPAAAVRKYLAVWLLTAGVGLSLNNYAAAGRPEDRALITNASPELLTSVFGVERSSETDLILLGNGEKLAGAVLNQTISLRTAYARLAFEPRMLAGMAVDNGQGIVAVTTVNNNRFSGFLEDASLIMQLSSGKRSEVRREKLGEIIFRVRPSELQGIPQGRWWRLKNNDIFSGQLQADSLALATARAQTAINFRDIVSMVVRTNGSAPTTVVMRNGQTAQGNLGLEDLPILLDIGPKFTLYKDYLAEMSEHRGQSSDSSLTPESSKTRLPFAVSISSSQTNVEGMVWIPAGEFKMGSPSDEPGRDQDEGPQTTVIIPQGFWMGKCEVTQGEYQVVIGSNPSNTTDDPKRPVEKVNWYEAMDFCAKLTQQTRAAGQLPDGYLYRLPSEAEWEYACRAHTATRFSFGDDKSDSQLENYAWFTRNSESMTHPVGTKRPNPWGLYDMHGNVWEWCLDRWEGFLPGGTVTNLAVRTEGTLRVARGGSWLYEARACRSANRDDYGPSNRCSDIGMRVVLAPLPPP